MFLFNWLQGFGWAIAKACAEAGAEISLGVWVSAGIQFSIAMDAAQFRGRHELEPHVSKFACMGRGS